MFWIFLLFFKHTNQIFTQVSSEALIRLLTIKFVSCGWQILSCRDIFYYRREQWMHAISDKQAGNRSIRQQWTVVVKLFYLLFFFFLKGGGANWKLSIYNVHIVDLLSDNVDNMYIRVLSMIYRFICISAAPFKRFQMISFASYNELVLFFYSSIKKCSIYYGTEIN